MTLSESIVEKSANMAIGGAVGAAIATVPSMNAGADFHGKKTQMLIRSRRMNRREFIKSAGLVTLVSASPLVVSYAGQQINGLEYPKTPEDLKNWINSKVFEVKDFIGDARGKPESGFVIGTYTGDQEKPLQAIMGAWETRVEDSSVLCIAAAYDMERFLEDKTLVIWRRNPAVTVLEDFDTSEKSKRLTFRAAFS